MTQRPRVVILGAGFGGLFAARALARTAVDVTVVDRHNYHLFQPLLYQVAVAGLPPSDIAWPIRSILRRQRNAEVLLDEVTGIDPGRRRVQLRTGDIGYDHLVVATGSTHSYFGHEDWAGLAPGLKDIDDATRIRRRILSAFERAEASASEARREGLMRFVIVGGGPTGVELAGTIAELARHTLVADFRRIDPASARITLIEAGPRLLAQFAPRLSDYARRSLERLGVEVLCGEPVTACDREGVAVGSRRIAAATVIWAAGVRASPVADWLGLEADRAGRVRVGPELSVPGLSDIYVIGDAALSVGADGRPVPGIAPAAKQQGRFVARLIADRIAGRPAKEVFRYRHGGDLATIGRRSAVIQFPRFGLTGWTAWWVWGIAHIYFLLGVPSPILISFRWLWEYLTYGRGARLITGEESAD